MWSHVLKPGTALRLTDVEGGANAGAMFYNFENLAERYNMPDTLKAQHISRLTAGSCLYTDMGRILLSITSDSLGWHDPIGGYSNAALVRQKYGEAPYQQYRNQYHRDAHTSFLLELAKYGMGERDLVACVNFFSKVQADDEGVLQFVVGHSKAGAQVELRAEMKTLIVLNTSQHPLDPNPRYGPKPVMASIVRVPPAGPDDVCRRSRPENERGFLLTERYHQ